MLKHKLVDFIIEFMEEVDKEVSEMKLFVCQSMTPYDEGSTLISSVERKSQIRGRVFFDSCKSHSSPAPASF
jgi:hypothetical protein